MKTITLINALTTRVRLNRFAATLSVATLCFAALSAPVSATDAILTDDTYAHSPSKNLNAGKSQTLKLEEGSPVYLKWDLSSLPYFTPYSAGYVDFPFDTTVAKATLRLYARSVKRPGSFSIYTPASDWNEDTLTSANAPLIDSGITCCVYVDSDDVNDEIVVDVTNLVLDWLYQDSPNFGIVLMADGSRNERETLVKESPSPSKSDKGIQVIFPSKESPTYSYRARLEITFGRGDYNDN